MKTAGYKSFGQLPSIQRHYLSCPSQAEELNVLGALLCAREENSYHKSICRAAGFSGQYGGKFQEKSMFHVEQKSAPSVSRETENSENATK